MCASGIICLDHRFDPPDAARKIGEVQCPNSLPGDLQKGFVTTSASYLNKRSYIADLSAAAKKPGRGKVPVFIRCFNSRCDDTVRGSVDFAASDATRIRKWTELHEILLQARGARWVIIGLTVIADLASGFAAKLLPWSGSWPR